MPEATPTGAEAEALIDAKLNKIAGIMPEKPEPEGEATPEGAPPEDEEGAGEATPAQEPKEGAGDEPAGPQIELSHVAAALGVEESALDVTDDGEIVFKTKVGEQEGIAKAAAIIKSYQLEGNLNKRHMEVAEREKAVETRLAQVDQFAAQRLQALDDTLKIANGLLYQEYQSVPWEQLKAQDPTTYAIRRQEFSDRQAALGQMFQRLEAERQDGMRNTMQVVEERRRQETEKLLSVIPEWRDSAKFESARKELFTGASEFYGFSNAEVGNTMDHRLLLMARDAIAYRNLQKSKPAVTQKVRIAPKVAKPGQAVTPAGKEAQLKALRERIRKSGGKEGVEDYLRQRGIG